MSNPIPIPATTATSATTATTATELKAKRPRGRPRKSTEGLTPEQVAKVEARRIRALANYYELTPPVEKKPTQLAIKAQRLADKEDLKELFLQPKVVDYIHRALIKYQLQKRGSGSGSSLEGDEEDEDDEGSQ